MATVNYPELLPHPLVSDGYGFRSNQSQAVSLFDVETQSRDETRTVNVGFTFTDLQYKVFHGWFMNVLVHGQKWFNMRLDGEFYEGTFGGVQPQYSLNRKIITVTATIKTRPSAGFVNYTNQRVSYPNTVNYMPSPFDPSGWNGATDSDGLLTIEQKTNPSGMDFIGNFEFIGGNNNVFAPCVSNYAGSDAGSYFTCLVIKQIGTQNHGLQSRFRNAGGEIESIDLNLSTGISTNEENVKIHIISESLKLVQFRHVYDGLSGDVKVELYWRKYNEDATSRSTPDIGSRFEAQAAFFGKTGKYQGAISYNAVNYMPSPFDPSGWFGATIDPDISYQSATEQNPSGESFAGEFEQVGAGSSQTLASGFLLPLVTGDYAYFSIISKQDIGIDSIRCFFQYEDGNTISDGSPVIGLDGSGTLPAGWETKVAQLSNGYSLLQVKMLANHDQTYRNVIYMQKGNGKPSIGDKVKLQAAYFGKANDWPAIITPADPDQFPVAITYEY